MYMCKKVAKIKKKIVTKVGYAVTVLDGSTMQNPRGPQDYFLPIFSTLLMIVSSNTKYVWELYDVISETWFTIRKLNIT